MTKAEALSYFDNSVSKLARFFRIGPSAVSMWDDKEIPKLREYQIREYIEAREPPNECDREERLAE